MLTCIFIITYQDVIITNRSGKIEKYVFPSYRRSASYRPSRETWSHQRQLWNCARRTLWRCASQTRTEAKSCKIQTSCSRLVPFGSRPSLLTSHLFAGVKLNVTFDWPRYFQARFLNIIPENHATRSSHQSTSFTTSSTQRTAPMCRPSATQRSPITTNCRAVLQQMTGGNPASVLYRSALTGELGWVMLVVCQRCVSWFLQFVAFTHRILEAQSLQNGIKFDKIQQGFW